MSGEGRFYEKEFPELDEIVVVQVKRIVEMGAYVNLLEYNGREGMMLLSELSKRRIRSVAKLLRVGRTEICRVLRADRDKGYIDLSKRRVEPEEAKQKEEEFAKSKAVHGIMRHVAGLHDVDPDELSNKVAWPLQAKYGDAHEALRKHINEEINIWEFITFNEPGEDLSDKAEKLKADIEISLRRRLIAQPLRMRAKVDVSCSEFEGIDAIKGALVKGMEASIEECEVKVKLIAHPIFMLNCTCRDKALGFSTLDKAIELIESSIKSQKGEFQLRTKPELVGSDDKDELAAEKSGSSSSGSSSSEEEGEQDDTMGQLDEKALADLMERTKDVENEEDEK
jgi:translation initiation factor 2 subunit 1